MAVKFEDYSAQVENAMMQAITAFLEEMAGEVLSGTARNYDSAGRVKTGQTKGSFDKKVVEQTAYMGSNYENAVWEEFGTGEYAEMGNGRKSAWKYKDDEGNWHTTHGKRGHRPFRNAYESKKKVIIQRAEEVLKSILG